MKQLLLALCILAAPPACAGELYVIKPGSTTLFTGTITHYEQGVRGVITLDPLTEYIQSEPNDKIFASGGDEIWWQWYAMTPAGWVQGAAKCSHQSNLRTDVIILECQ